MIMTADRIKYLREQKGITQSELAAMFHVSTDYLLCVEKSTTVGVEGLTESDIQLVHTVIEHLREKNG